MQLPLRFYQQVFRHQLVGILYHVISDEPLPHIRHLYPNKNPGQFEADLVYLKANFQVICYDQLLESHLTGRKLPSNAAVLSFDDGLAECYSVVRPLLHKHQLPCTFFICTDVIDNRQMLYRHRVSLCIDKLGKIDPCRRQEIYHTIYRDFNYSIGSINSFTRWIKSFTYIQKGMVDEVCRLLDVDIEEYLQTSRPYLTADEIYSLSSEGFTIGAHTRAHPKLQLLAPDEAEREIVSSCDAVASLVKKDQVPFAFPFNALSINRDLVNRIVKNHSSVGLLFDAKGVRQKNWIYNRLIVDQPFPGVNGSDLPLHLQKAYAEAYNFRRLIAPLTNRHLWL